MCLTKGQRKARDQTTHCAYCERKLYKKGGDRPTVDHFYPLSSGKDLNRYWNRLTVCYRCNQMKGNKSPLALIAWCQKQLTKPGHSVQYISDLKSIINNISRHRDELEGWYIMRDLI